jgi:hypothetical protein
LRGIRSGYVSIYQIVPRPMLRSETAAALPDHGLARGRATIPGRRDRGLVDERNAVVGLRPR